MVNVVKASQLWSSAASSEPAGFQHVTDRLVDAVLPWLHEAGNPYYDWFFGSAEAARMALRGWMRRSSSEVSLERLWVVADEGRPIGGMLALGGAELAECRRADAVAAVKDVGDRRALIARARESKRLFGPVEPDQFYLSKIGVLELERRKGIGGQLMGTYVETGARQGFRRFRLDVSSDKGAALTLYRRFGFEVTAEHSSDEAGASYLAMEMEREGA